MRLLGVWYYSSVAAMPPLPAVIFCAFTEQFAVGVFDFNAMMTVEPFSELEIGYGLGLGLGLG
eukprot:6194365-Pleurochrysis_carterae.AAC.1